MQNKEEFLWMIRKKIQHRMGIEETNDVLIAAIFTYCINEKLDVEDDNELYSYANELLAKLPSDLLNADIREYLDNQSFEEIKQLVIELVETKKSKEGTTSKELSRLVCELLDLRDGDTLLDLGSGSGRFLINAGEYTNYKKIKLSKLDGAEINYGLWLISRMALGIIYPRTYGGSDITTKNIELQDSLFHTTENKYTKEYTYAPLGAKLVGGTDNIPTIFKGEYLSSRNSAEWIFIDKMLRSADQDAKYRGVALVSGRALFNYADKSYINSLLKEGLIEGIIELPRGIVEEVQINTFLIVFSRGNKKVRFLDCSNLFDNEVIKDSNKMVFAEHIFNRYKDDSTLKTINELVLLQNLAPSVVLLKVKILKDAEVLGEVAEVFSGSQYTNKRFIESFSDEETGFQILTSSDIEGGFVNWESLQSILCEDKKLEKYALQENDLVITAKSSKIKIIVFDQKTAEKIIVTGGMLIVRPNINLIHPTFLRIYLESEDGMIALKKIQKGQTIITINASDLKTILVPVPAMEYQKKLAMKYANKISALKVLRFEIKNLEEELKNFYLEEELMAEE